MTQNRYDDPGFFARYSAMWRSREGLDAAGEWHVFRTLLPPLRDHRVIDLGCGFGWHCRYARDQQARRVLGIDLSERMLARARALGDAGIEYRRAAIEDAELGAAEFDVAISSLALHYVERFDLVCRRVHRCLAPGGAFVLSVEHPIFTARAVQEWHYGPAGERLHWPVDDYQNEGIRRTSWLAEDVVKYHRTVATHVNALIDAGFAIARVAEPEPPVAMREHPDFADEDRRPMFLLIAATKPPTAS